MILKPKLQIFILGPGVSTVRNGIRLRGNIRNGESPKLRNHGVDRPPENWLQLQLNSLFFLAFPSLCLILSRTQDNDNDVSIPQKLTFDYIHNTPT